MRIPLSLYFTLIPYINNCLLQICLRLVPSKKYRPEASRQAAFVPLKAWQNINLNIKIGNMKKGRLRAPSTFCKEGLKKMPCVFCL